MAALMLHRTTTHGLLRALKSVERPCSLRLASLLSSRRGRVFPPDEVFDALWGDDPDGGPMATRNVVSVYAHYLRLAGLEVRSESNRGYIIRSGESPR